jgi:hypothetical protein
MSQIHRATKPPFHPPTRSLGHQATDHPPIGSPELLGHLGHHISTPPFGSPGSPKRQGYWVTYPPHRPGLKPQAHLSTHIQDPGLGSRIKPTDPEPNTRARATTHRPRIPESPNYRSKSLRATEHQITRLPLIHPSIHPSHKPPGSHPTDPLITRVTGHQTTQATEPQVTRSQVYGATDPPIHPSTNPGSQSHRVTGPLSHRATEPQNHRAPNHPIHRSQTYRATGPQGHHLPIYPKCQGQGLHPSIPQTRVRAKATDPPIHPDPRLRVTDHRPQTQDPRATEPQGHRTTDPQSQEPRATMITDLGSWIPPIGHPQNSKKPGGHLAP